MDGMDDSLMHTQLLLEAFELIIHEDPLKTTL